MKTLVHLGMPKAGSTTLQFALNDSREVLLTQGILYPETGIHKGYNHGLLVGEVLPYESGPRMFRRLSLEDHKKRVSEFLTRLEQQIRQTKPDVLILSSEYLWRLNEPGQTNMLQRLLTRLGVEDIEFLAYIRRPSSFFLSAAQQRLRASACLTPTESYDAAAILNVYRSTFLEAQITARLFDYRSLTDGDVLVDFLERFLPEQRENVLQATRTSIENYTLSAESMAVLQNYRRYFFADNDDVFNMATARFVRLLREVDELLGLPRPILHSEICDFIDYGNASPLELRDRFEIVFPDFDYLRLEQGQFAKCPGKWETVRDIVRVSDEGLREVLVALQLSIGKNDDSISGWLDQLPQRLGLCRNNQLLGWIYSRRRHARIKNALKKSKQ